MRKIQQRIEKEQSTSKFGNEGGPLDLAIGKSLMTLAGVGSVEGTDNNLIKVGSEESCRH